MALQRHPVDSYDEKINFWEEFPEYKIHPIFGIFKRINSDAGLLKNSSKFMWLMVLCYDRKSSFYAQPELEKWEANAENFFGDKDFVIKLLDGKQDKKVLLFQESLHLPVFIAEFEKTLDTPIGLALRILEKKLAERTAFINITKYTMDWYEIMDSGKPVLRKGTADQLDRMFANTDKINSLILKAMENLKSVAGVGIAKGGQKESLGDGDKSF